MYDELVKQLRDNAEFLVKASSGCLSNSFADTMCQAADAIEELSKPRWIPVTERLPKEMETVIVTTGKNVGFSFCVNDYGTLEFYSPWNITHWMPLPEPPDIPAEGTPNERIDT